VAGVVLCLSLAVAAQAQRDAAVKPAPETAATSPSKKTPAKPAPRKDAVRTLDAIRIEGEIDVPQVLFITARDTRRFRDGTGTRYLATSGDVAKSIPAPARLRMVAPE
jgi:hypothetical protein